jgi:hypothetical protein
VTRAAWRGYETVMEKLYSQVRGDTAVPSASLPRRPDVALFDIEVAVDDLAATPAHAVLHASLQKVARALPSHATLAVVDYDMPGIPALIKAEPSSARLHARITVDLPAEAGVEERATRLATVDDVLRGWVLEGKKAKPALQARRHRPVCVLSDAGLETARVELLAQWQRRVAELQKLGTVKVKDVRPLAPVRQVPVGLDRVDVSMDLGGTVTLVLPGS